MTSKSDPFAPPSYQDGCKELEAQLASTMFECKPRRKVLSLQNCLDDYLDVNAMEKKRSCCWRCSLGQKNREGFAEEGATGIFEDREWQAAQSKKKAGGETTRKILASLGAESKGEDPAEQDEEDLAPKKPVGTRAEIEEWMKKEEKRQEMSKAKQAELFGAVMEVLDEGAECGLGDLYREVLGKQEGNQQKRGALLEVLKEMERHKWVVNRGNVKHPTYVVHHEIVGLYGRLVKAGDGAVTELCQQQNKQVQMGLSIEHKIYLLDPLPIKDFGVGSASAIGESGAVAADVGGDAPVEAGGNAAAPPDSDDGVVSLSPPLEVAVMFYNHYQGKNVPWGNVDWQGVGCFTNKGGARDALRIMDRLGYGKLEPNKAHPTEFVWVGDPNEMALDFDGNVVGKKSKLDEPTPEPSPAQPPPAAPEPPPESKPEPEFDWTKVPAVSSDKMPIEERHAGMFEACQNGRPGCPLKEFMRISGRPIDSVNGIWASSAYQLAMTMRRDGLIKIIGSRETGVVIWIKNPKNGEPFTYQPIDAVPPSPEAVAPIDAAADSAAANNDDASAAAATQSPPAPNAQSEPANAVVDEPEPVLEPTPESPAPEPIVEPAEELMGHQDGCSCPQCRPETFSYRPGEESTAAAESVAAESLSAQEPAAAEPKAAAVLEQPPETRDGMEDGTPPTEPAAPRTDPGHIEAIKPEAVPPGRTDGLLKIGRVMAENMLADAVGELTDLFEQHYPDVAAIIINNPTLAPEFGAKLWEKVMAAFLATSDKQPSANT